jgi:RNase adaptor protein for sRNA GlmZ degradation
MRAYLETGICLTLPFPRSKLRLEIGQSVQVHAFVFLVQLSRSFLSLADNLLNVVIDRQAASRYEASVGKTIVKYLDVSSPFFRIDNLPCTVLNHIQKILLVLSGY